jgi:hypothetical protein
MLLSWSREKLFWPWPAFHEGPEGGGVPIPFPTWNFGKIPVPEAGFLLEIPVRVIEIPVNQKKDLLLRPFKPPYVRTVWQKRLCFAFEVYSKLNEVYIGNQAYVPLCIWLGETHNQKTQNSGRQTMPVRR